MRKATKIWLITATSLVLMGIIIFGGVMTMLKWNFKKLSTVKHETNTYEINEEFNNISIDTNTADIIFVPSDNEKCKVVAFEEKKVKHSVVAQEGTLKINAVDTRKWYDYISFFTFSTPKITVYLPHQEYESLVITASTGDVSVPKEFGFKKASVKVSTGDIAFSANTENSLTIKASTGDISVRDIAPKSLSLQASTGDITVHSAKVTEDINAKTSTGNIKFTEVECRNVTTVCSTGNAVFNKFTASEKVNITTDTGDVKILDFDAGTIKIKTDTGDVSGNVLTDKIFFAETDTGKVDVPKTVSGGICEINTDTGDIKISIK